MRKFFEPAAAPAWLKTVLASVRAALGDVWDVPLRPFQAGGADLPAAAGCKGALAWNATSLTVTWSDGTAWKVPQPADPQLDAIAALTPAADQLAYWTGATSAALTGLTAFGRSLVDDANATAAGVTLGLAALAYKATISNADWSGADLDIANGGTGASSASAARGNLGLGTAATQNTGTSGAAVPLLNAANAWSAAQSVTIATGSGSYALAVTHNGGTVARNALNVVTAGTSAGTIALRVSTGTVAEALNVFGDGNAAFGGNVDLASGKAFKVNAAQVVGARRTGWSTATGTATRTAFDTASVTLPQLAERVKALLDDLHASAGHGLIGS